MISNDHYAKLCDKIDLLANRITGKTIKVGKRTKPEQTHSPQKSPPYGQVNLPPQNIRGRRPPGPDSSLPFPRGMARPNMRVPHPPFMRMEGPRGRWRGPMPPRHMMEGPPLHIREGPPPHMMEGLPPHMMEGPPPPHMMDGPPHRMMEGPPHMRESLHDGPLLHAREGPPQHMMEGPQHMMEGPQHFMDAPQNFQEGVPHPHEVPHMRDGPVPPPQFQEDMQPRNVALPPQFHDRPLDGPIHWEGSVEHPPWRDSPPLHVMDRIPPPHMMEVPREHWQEGPPPQPFPPTGHMNMPPMHRGSPIPPMFGGEESIEPPPPGTEPSCKNEKFLSFKLLHNIIGLIIL